MDKIIKLLSGCGRNEHLLLCIVCSRLCCGSDLDRGMCATCRQLEKEGLI